MTEIDLKQGEKMELKEIENKIEKIKQELLKIEGMRPGSLSERYNVCGVKKCRCKDQKNPQKHGPYMQLSFVHQGKNATKFIRAPFVRKIEKETDQYRKFKELTGQWIILAMERSDQEMRLKTEEKNKTKQKS
jgi:hypothetical protein